MYHADGMCIVSLQAGRTPSIILTLPRCASVGGRRVSGGHWILSEVPRGKGSGRAGTGH